MKTIIEVQDAEIASLRHQLAEMKEHNIRLQEDKRKLQDSKNQAVQTYQSKATRAENRALEAERKLAIISGKLEEAYNDNADLENQVERLKSFLNASELGEVVK